jgi:hypothetical protein
MQLRLRRIAFKEQYTIGKLEVWKDNEWAYLCDTIENKVRDTCRGKPIVDAPKMAYTYIAIPCGLYKISLNIVSPEYTNYKRYFFARKYHGCMPRLINTNSLDGILIQPGCSAYYASGSIVVGKNKVVGKVVDSVQVWCSLMENYFVPAKKAKETITIEII